MNEPNSSDKVLPELNSSTTRPLVGNGSIESDSGSGESSDPALALEGLIDFDPDTYPQRVLDEESKTIIQEYSYASTADKPLNDLEPEYQIINKIVQRAMNGDMDFFDIKSKEVQQDERFKQIFHDVMKKEFGVDNGEFLLHRHETNKLSPLMKKRVKQIFRFAMELFHQEMLLKEDSILKDLKELYLAAFKKNGLDEIDSVIDLVNEQLNARGAKFGIGPGCASVGDQYGNTEYISIVFCKLDTEDIIMVEWCDVKPDMHFAF